MTAIAKIESPELDERQARFVALLLKDVPEDEAAKQAGYSETTPAATVLAGKAVQAALSRGCAGRLAQLKLKAVRTLDALLSDGPAATKFNAAKLVLEYGDDEDGGEQKPLTELSIAELEELVRRKEAQLRDVTPSNGA
jgi:phage terminase small subunit